MIAPPNAYRNSSTKIIGWMVAKTSACGVRSKVRKFRPATAAVSENAASIAVVIIAAGKVAGTGTPAQLKARHGTVLFDLGFAGPSVAETACSVLAAGGYQPDRDGAGIRVRSAAGSAALTGVLRALEGRAPDPVSVAVREPTLDDVFRSLTEGEG